MAAGGQSLSQTLEAHCVVYYDFSCSPCERRNGTNSEANHYCTECDELFCKTCLAFHGSFQQSKDHNILGKDNVKSWRKQKNSIQKSSTVFQEQCTRHPGQHVTMFCANHNALICHLCVSLEHRHCEGMQNIPDVAAGIKQSPYYTAVIKDFERIQSNINIVKKSRQQTKSSIDKSYKDFVDVVRGFRKHVNDVFDYLETKAKTDTDKVHTESISNADNDLEACDIFLADLKWLEQHLEPTNTPGEDQLFVNMKKFEQKIAECDEEVQRMAETTDTASFKLTIDPKITSFLTGLHNLGKISIKPSTTPYIDTDKHVMKYNKHNNKDTKINSPRVYKAKTCHKHNIKVESDKTDCRITGSCVMPDGSIILTDYTNFKLEHLNTSYHVIDDCYIPGVPWAVCCIGQQEVAVATMSNTISFVPIVKHKMSVTRFIETEKSCRGIAYNNNKLYVSDHDGKVYIYNISGTCLSIIHKDQNGQGIFSLPQHLAWCLDGSRLYVADCYKGLVVLDDSGRHLSTYEQDAKLNGAYGICVDDKGSVFVGCCRSKNVVQLSDDGTRKLGEVAKLEDGEGLESICLDKRHHRLILTLAHTNYIKVFHLK